MTFTHDALRWTRFYNNTETVEENTMAGSRTQNKNSGSKASQKDRFLKGTEEPVVRLLSATGKRRFVWAIKNGDGGYRHVGKDETELR